jgi:hypothetical protein
MSSGILRFWVKGILLGVYCRIHVSSSCSGLDVDVDRTCRFGALSSCCLFDFRLQLQIFVQVGAASTSLKISATDLVGMFRSNKIVEVAVSAYARAAGINDRFWIEIGLTSTTYQAPVADAHIGCLQIHKTLNFLNHTHILIHNTSTLSNSQQEG